MLSRGYRCEAEAGPNEGQNVGTGWRWRRRRRRESTGLQGLGGRGYIPGLESPSHPLRARGEFGLWTAAHRVLLPASLSDDVALTPPFSLSAKFAPRLHNARSACRRACRYDIHERGERSITDVNVWACMCARKRATVSLRAAAGRPAWYRSPFHRLVRQNDTLQNDGLLSIAADSRWEASFLPRHT